MTQGMTEIVIIGGGVIGTAIAYHLARQGRQVLVVERGGIATKPAASWASGGGLRRQGRHPAEAALASEAIARWHNLEAELDADLHYRQDGNLLLAEDEDSAVKLVAFVQTQQQLGFTDVRLLDAREVHDLVPGLCAHVVAGSYSPRDGQANPPHTARAFATAAQQHGAIFWTETPVQTLLTTSNRVRGVQTDRGSVLAETVVLAAGAWSCVLASRAGLRLPIRTVAYQMLRSTPARLGLLRPVLSTWGHQFSLKQLVDGSFLVGGNWEGDPTPDGEGYKLRAASIIGAWADACSVFAAVGQQRLAKMWCGLEAESIDDIPLIGPVPELKGLTLALGFSGHGFALAPAVGRALADQIAGYPTPELDGLTPGRLARLDAKRIAGFLSNTV